jgi:Fuc2NAc and GlcNAc transferase
MWTEVTAVVLSALLTLAVRQYARRKNVMDHPNERSSHERPTPHGGGIAILGALFCVLFWEFAHGNVDTALFGALLCAVPIAIVSLVDDLRPLSACLRLGVQGMSALAALILLGGVGAFSIGGNLIEGVWLNIIAMLMLLWMTNLYNFLDGIDGYAGSEAVFVGVAAYLLFGNGIGLLIAAAALGFLVFNWHKASIFMGDVGSAPLGFIFAVLALHDAATPGFIGWLVLLSLFWFDATVTLWRRWRNGERLSQAHKKHAYQRLHQAGWPHDRIVIAGMALNAILFVLLWLFGPERYGFVFLAAIALLWLAMKYVDRKKAFV